MSDKPKLLIFASGSRDGGGSGFENLVERQKVGEVGADIVGVVSNHENGGVRERADRLGIEFIHFPKPWTGEGYRKIASQTGADFFALSGWLKKVEGLDPRFTFNIHPGPLPLTEGLYGHHVHERVFAALNSGKIDKTEVCMHFVTGDYDKGPIFFRIPITIVRGDDVESIAKRVNRIEHKWQPIVTNLLLRGEIHWDGSDPKSLVSSML